MEPDITRHLRELREYLEKISADRDKNPLYSKYTQELDGKLLEEIAATATGGISEKALSLIKKLESAGKTSRMINERFPRMSQTYSSEDEENILKAIQELESSALASTDEDGDSEAIQEQENLASTDEDSDSEAIQEQENLASTDEDGGSKAIQEQENLASTEDKTAECAQDQESTAHTSSDEGKNKRPFPNGDSEKLSKERKTFLIQMNVSQFSSKEVEVNVREKYLEIHAKHEKMIDEHGIVSREFTRKFDIPENVDPETFRVLYDCYGVLHVEASFMPDNTKGREINIFLDKETAWQQHGLESLEDLGREFEELAQRYIKDGSDMAEFARHLIKQYPSDYIPIEEVVIP